MKTNQKKEYTEAFDGFKGLDTSSPIGSGRLSELRNFKVLDDGSLLKRSGFRVLSSLPQEPRGVRVYSDGGEEVILAVIGNSLYRILLSDGSYTSSEVFSTTEGRAGFFEAHGRLYIVDGAGIWRYTGGTSITEASGYASLYAKDLRANENVSPINESNKTNRPFNLLSSRIRIEYICEESSVGLLDVGIPLISIDGILLNGKVQDISGFSFTREKKGVLGNLECDRGTTVTLYVTVDKSGYEDSEFNSYTRTAVFDSFDATRVFLYGGNDANRFYVSDPIDDETFELQKKLYGEIDRLYFGVGESLGFGGMESISGMCKLYDRMMIFSKNRSWFSSSLCEDEGKERHGVALDVLSDICGCSSDDAVTLIGGATPITVSRGGIYKWSIDGNFEEEAVITRISDKISSHITQGFLRNAKVCYSRDTDELWFADPTSQNGEVFVYNRKLDVWYIYDGISAEQLFETGAGMAFLDNGIIYLFDTEDSYDRLVDGERDVEAVVASGGFDFGAPFKKKHVCGAHITCNLDGGSIKLSLDDGRALGDVEFDRSRASDIYAGAEFFDLKIRTSRTKCVRFELRALGRNRQRIYSAEFFAN